VGEVRAEGVALVIVHRVLKQRAENFRLNLDQSTWRLYEGASPVANLQSGGCTNNPPLKVTHALNRRRAWRIGVHGLEQSANEIVGASRRGAVVEDLRDEILGQARSMSSAKRATSICRMKRCAIGLRHAALRQLLEAIGEAVSGLPRDAFHGRLEGRLRRSGREKASGP